MRNIFRKYGRKFYAHLSYLELRRVCLVQMEQASN